jgi:hypothetical protein
VVQDFSGRSAAEIEGTGSMTGKVSPDLWALASIIYVARKREASGWRLGEPVLPNYDSYTHKATADMDLAIVCAKAVLAAGYKKELKVQAA